MQEAKNSLKGKWGIAVGTYLLYTVLTSAVHSIPGGGGLLGLVVSGPMALGIAMVSLDFSRGKIAKIEQIFEGFRNFSTSLGAYLLMVLYIILWSLLLIVPGVIAAISYSMVFFIIADNSSTGIKEALEKSRAMMDGYKMKFFTLCLRFLGLSILCILTLGIGFLWLIPYWHVTAAKFYEDVAMEKLRASAEGI